MSPDLPLLPVFIALNPDLCPLLQERIHNATGRLERAATGKSLREHVLGDEASALDLRPSKRERN